LGTTRRDRADLRAGHHRAAVRWLVPRGYHCLRMAETFDDPGGFEFEEAAVPYEPDEAAVGQSAVGAVVRRHEQELLAIDGVEGVGVGQSSTGQDAVVVYAREQEVADQLPSEIDAFPVTPVVTGEISAY